LAFLPTSGAEKHPPPWRVDAMNLDHAKSLSRRSLEMWASKNTDTPEEVFAQNYVNHQESAAKGGVRSLDLKGWKDVVQQNHRAFSNFQVDILTQIDRIADGKIVESWVDWDKYRLFETLGFLK
jgi:hypothetical protein